MHRLKTHAYERNPVEAKVENNEENQTKIVVEVPAGTVDEKVKKVYREFASKYNFPGFRKGKAPRAVIDNAVGRETVLAQVTEDVVNDAYPEVVEEQRLYPVGSPNFGDVGMVEPGQPFTFEFTVGKKPAFELSSYDPVEIEIPFSEATETEIDEQVQALTRHYETYENAASDVPSSADNYAELEMSAAKEDGQQIEALTSDSRLFVPGGGLFNDAFDNEIFGMKKGESKKFTLEVPEDESSVLLSDLAGQKVDFDVTCTVVKTKEAPELTDEFVKEKIGFDTLADLREEVKKSITDQKSSVIPRIKENACAAKLIERLDEDVPENMAEEAESELLQDFFGQLQQQGMTFDGYLAARGIDSDQFKRDIKMQAADEAKQQLALDAWARKNGIDVTDEEVTLEFERAGVEDPKKTEREWRKSGRLFLIREGIIRRKAMENVMETAKVTEVDFAARDKDEEKK